MTAWRVLGSVVLFVATGPSAWAQSYPLTETAREGDCYRFHLSMRLSGEMRVSRGGMLVPLKLEATATHEFPERILNVDTNGLPSKSARVYEKARSVITVEGNRSERSLRPERRLFVAQWYKDTSLVYSPSGPLTHEELELTSEHFDTLAVTGLLPGKEVAVGDTWKVANQVVQALCNFEGLTEQDLVCKLEEVKDQVARVSVTGAATGIELGALVKLNIQATYQFDVTARRLTAMEWKQKDQREQGPASPASSVATTITLTRTVIDRPAALNDVALASVAEGFEPPTQMTHIEYRDGKGRFEAIFGREWQTVSVSDDHVVLRFLDRGDFVAQVTLTPWTKAEKGKHLSPAEFQQAMAATPGWQPEDELQAGEVPVEGGRWIYRISALGQLDGTKVMQNFYLIAAPNGEQVVVAFTMTPKQVDRLGSRDLSLAANIDFPSSRRDPVKPE